MFAFHGQHLWHGAVRSAAVHTDQGPGAPKQICAQRVWAVGTLCAVATANKSVKTVHGSAMQRCCKVAVIEQGRSLMSQHCQVVAGGFYLLC